MKKEYSNSFGNKNHLLNSVFILLMIFSMCISSRSLAQTNCNPFGFEDNTLNGWTAGSSTESVIINTTAANVRTGTYSLGAGTTSTSSNKYWYTNSVYGASASGTYIHFIYWVKTADAGISVDASMRYASSSPPSGTGSTANASSAVALTAGIWTQVSYNAGNSNSRWYFPAPRRTAGGATTLYIDDGIIYTSNSNTTDLTDPLTPSAITGVAASPNVNLSWTSNTDAGTGVQATILLRTSNAAAAVPVLNDQAIYSVAGGASGPNTIGDWTVISTTTGATATAYTDNSVPNGSYKYAVVLRDLAYNYSAAAVSSPVTVGTVTAPSLLVDQTGFNGTYGNTVMNTNSAARQFSVSGTNLTNNIMVTAPAGFQVSTASASGYGTTVTLTPTAGTVATTTIYARYAPTAATGASGNLDISVATTGTTTQNITVNGNALATEPVSAGTITFGTVATTSIVVNLPTIGNGSKRIIVVKQGIAPTFTPVDAVAITGVNANFTTATDQGGGNKIVYDGAGSGNGVVTVAGLTAGTLYFFTVFEYNEGTGTSQNYLLTPVATGSASTAGLPSPAITVNQAGFTGTFGNVVTGSNSTTQQYTVSGANLTSDIVLTAPAAFSISLAAASGFTNTLTLAQSSGAVAATTIYVRYSPAAATGATGSLNITHTSTGATAQNVTVNGNAIAAEPTSAGTLSFGATTLNSIVVNLPTVGNGSKRIIVAKAAGAVTFTPTDGTAATGVNANFTTATDQGTGNKIIYDGNGSGNAVVTVTGLASGTTYYFTVYEYNTGTGTSQNYLLTPVATGSAATVTPTPVVTVNQTGFTGNFGNVVMATNSAVQQYSVSGANLTAGLIITPPTGFQVSTNATSGFGTSLTLSPSAGTVANTTIYVRFSPNAATGATGSVTISNASTGAATQTVAVSGNALSTQPSSAGTITFGTITSNSIVVNLPTIGNGSRRIIVAKQGSAPSFVPADGIAVNGVNPNITLATDQGGGDRIIYDGPGTGSGVALVNGLTPNTAYYFTVFEYNVGTGTSHNYLAAPFAAGNTTTLNLVPDIAVVQSAFNGNFGNVVTGTVSASRQYTVSATGLSTDMVITAPAEFKISLNATTGFTGTLTLTQAGGSISTTTIYVQYQPAAATGTSGSLNITHTSTGATTRNVAVSGNALDMEPSAIGTITFGTVTDSTIEVNLPTVGNGAKRIIVTNLGSPAGFVPADGTAVTGINTVYGTATTQAGGGKIIYEGAGSGNSVVTLTGLTAGMLYYFTVYEYNVGTGSSQNYLTSQVVESNMTTSVYVPNGIKNTPAAALIKIYPNPVKNYVFAEAPFAMNMILADVSGKVVLRGTEVKQLDMTTLPAGYYNLIITDKKGGWLKCEKIWKAD